MNEAQQKHYNSTFSQRYDHRMEFADFMTDYILNIPIDKVPLRRIYAVYDQFQERLCKENLPDNETVFVMERDQSVVEMVKIGKEVNIKIKIGRKWVDIRCPLELIKFADWWLYT